MTARMRGGGAVTRGLQAALHHREQYMSALRQHRIDDADAALRQRIGVPRMLLWRNTTTTTTTRPASPQLVLPPQWLEHATHALTHVCGDVVPSSVLRSSDYLLCALVHPTYVRPQTVRCPTRTGENNNSGSNSNTSTTAAATAAAVATLRAQLAMPLELSLCGGAAVRILASLAQQHARAAAAREAQELVAAADEDTQGDDDDDDDDNKQHTDDTAAAAAASSTTAASSAARRRLQRQLQRQRRSAGRPLQPYVPQRVPVLDTHALATLPAVMGVAQHILYDADAFVAQHDANTSAAAPATTPSVPPHEVCVAAAVALCGAVDVTAGLSAVAALLDRALRTS